MSSDGLAQIVHNSRIVLLDLDGTAIDSIPRHIDATRSWVASFVARGLLRPEKQAEMEDAARNQRMAVTAKQFLGEDYSEQEAEASYGREYEDSRKLVTVFPGTIDAIVAMRSKDRPVVGVTVGNYYVTHSNLELLQAAYQRAGHAGFVLDGRNFNIPGEPVKPDPLIFQYILRNLGESAPRDLKPEEALVVGDAGTDCQLAINLNAPFIYIYTGSPKPDLVHASVASFDGMARFSASLRAQR